MFRQMLIYFVMLFPCYLLSQQVTVINFAQLESMMKNNRNDTLHIYNFWATWCAPCVKELPLFEALKTKESNTPIKVYLISLDFKKSYEKQLVPFVKNKKLQWPVYLLAEPNSNSWIDKVNQEWSGAVPATLMIHQNKTSFYEQAFENDELNETIKTFLKP